MSTHWDKLSVSRPINATAGRVASRSNGIGPRGPKAAPHHFVSDAPLRTVPVASCQEDLSGRDFGRFKVVGYLGRQGSDKGRWLVRCVCGVFEQRSAKAITNPANGSDACRDCRHLAHLRAASTSMTHRPDGSKVRA